MSDDPNDPYGGFPPAGGAAPPGAAPTGPTGPAGPAAPAPHTAQAPAQGGGYGGYGGYGQPPGAMGPTGSPPQSQGYGYGGPPGGGGGEPTEGWKIAAIVLLVIGPVLSMVGMIPCLGILNWIAIPANVALCIIGILGLTIGPKEPDGRPAHFPLHVAAIVVGLLLAIASIVRCTMGSGLI